MVGRILYLKNNHIPPVEDLSVNEQYISFGYYDWIGISENLFTEQEQSLLRIWERTAKDTNTLIGEYSLQAMYLFNDDDAKHDDNFWNSQDLPFIFIIVLQLNVRNGPLNAVRTNFEKKIKGYCVHNKIKIEITSYLMLDENDIALIIKSQSYKIGKEIANSLHGKDNSFEINGKIFNVAYSFSFSGIINSCDGTSLDDVPDYCNIHLIERFPGSIGNIILEMEKKISGTNLVNYPTFGRDDNLLVFKPSSWEQILKLYKENGIFNNETLYCNNVLSVSTHFMYNNESMNAIDFKQDLSASEDIVEEESLKKTKIIDKFKMLTGWLRNSVSKQGENIESFEELEQGLNQSQEFTNSEMKICKKLIYRVQKLYARLLEKDSLGQEGKIQRQMAYYKAILQILNSINEFEYDVSPDYIFISIFAPLAMLVKKMEIKEQTSPESLMDDDGIYRFLTAINQVAQNSIRAERHFMNIPELNSISYYVPIKMYAFYAAFVHKTKDFLNMKFGERQSENDTKNFYEFILYPGMNTQIQINRIFYSPHDRNRLLLIEIPEKEIYDPQHIMIALSHEIGHFVGSRLRKREYRYEILSKALARMIALYAYLKEDMAVFMTKKGIERLISGIDKEIRIRIEYEKNINEEKKAEKVKQKNSSNQFDTVLHSEYLEIILMKAVDDFFVDCMSGKIQPFDVVFEEYLKGHGKGNINEFYKKRIEFNKVVNSYVCKLNTPINSLLTEDRTYISAYSMIDVLLTIILEGFADLVSILVLDLDYTDYYESIFKGLSLISVKELVNSDLFIRMVLVTKIMVDCNKWSFYDSKKKNRENTVMLNFIKEVQKYLNRIKSHKDVFSSLRGKRETLLNIFLDATLLNDIILYFKECKSVFEKEFCGKHDNELLSLRNDFKIITGKNEGEKITIEKRIMHINNVIEKYRTETKLECYRILGK